MFEIIDLARFFGTSYSVSSKDSETVENTQRDGQQAKKNKKEKENGQTINIFESEIKMGLFPGLV